MSAKKKGKVRGTLQHSRQNQGAGQGGRGQQPQPPQPTARTIVFTKPAGPILLGTPLNAALFAARPSAGPGDVTVSKATADTAGKQTITLRLAASGTYGAATQPVEIDVTVPERQLDWAPPASIVFGTDLTLASVGAVAGEGPPLQLEFPLGPLAVGQGQGNLKLVAPGQPGVSRDAVRTATITVTPAPRTIVFNPPPQPILLGTALDAALFAARPSAGPGDVTASKATADAEGKQTITLSLAASGNYGPATQPVEIEVILPERQLNWTPPVNVVYGTKLTVADVAVVAGEGDPPRLEFPNGELAVAQPGPNLRIVAPGKPGASRDAVRDATVAVTPAPRTVKYTALPKNAKVRVGETLSFAKFKASASVGTAPVIVTAPVNGLVTAVGALDVVLGFAPDPNYADTPVTIPVVVEKGQPAITWSNPGPIAINAAIGGTQLNAAITPGCPGPIEYVMVLNDQWVNCAGQSIPKKGQYFMKARFRGHANWLPAEKEVRLLVTESARAVAGANAMSSAASIAACWNTPTDAESQAVLAAWNSDTDNIKTQGQQILAKAQTMNEEQLRKYCKSLKGARQKPPNAREDENVTWLLPNGLQLRLKPKGDRHTRSVMFSIEAVKDKTKFSDDLGGVAFKLANCGEPAPKTPGEASSAPGNAAQRSDFLKGVAAATHIKCQPMQPNEITWPLVNGTNIQRNTDLPAATCLGEAVIEYWMGTQKLESPTLRAAARNNVEVSVRTQPTTQFKLTIVKRTVNIVG